MADEFKKKLKRELDKCDDFLDSNFKKTMQQYEKTLFKSTNPSELKREANSILELVKWKIKMLKRREIIEKRMQELN